MSETRRTIPIILNNTTIFIELIGDSSEDKIFEAHDAVQNGEERFQIVEGCSYEYKLPLGFCLENSELVRSSKFDSSAGRISPNVYVGTLIIPVLNVDTKCKAGDLCLEVQSIKASYREDYRTMLEDITEHCTELLMQHSSPASQYFGVDFNADSKTIYQRFSFIKSVVDSTEFNEAVHKFVASPVKGWKESQIVKDLRSVKKFNDNYFLRQLASARNRIDLPEHCKIKRVMNSIPAKIIINCKLESVDIAENRFIKHANPSVSVYLYFAIEIPLIFSLSTK